VHYELVVKKDIYPKYFKSWLPRLFQRKRTAVIAQSKAACVFDIRKYKVGVKY